jgi:CHAT domain-containing protein/tetratricopeptide (TPR) repeat protein
VHKRAIALHQQGNIQDATATAERAVALLEGAVGTTHALVAIPLSTVAMLYQRQGAYPKAEILWLRVVAIQEQALGATDIDLTDYLDQLASLYREWGMYGKAERLYIRTLTIRRRVLRPEHPDRVANLNNLAWTYEKQGKYSQAEPLYTEAVEIAQKTLGPWHSDVARGLNGLAMLYWAQGTYERAEPLLVRALDIRQKLLIEVRRHGPEDVYKVINFFKGVREQRFKTNSKSKPSPYASHLSMFANAVSEMNSRAVEGLSNVDELYFVAGEKTEPLTTRSADVFERVLESAHLNVTQSLEVLAQHYLTTGKYVQAEPLLLRALDAQEKALGAMHPDVANNLNNLAQLYQTLGAYTKAEPLLIRALEVRRKAYGEVHADVARGLNNLALLYGMQGAHANAEPLLRQAVTIFEKTLGVKHPDVARSLNNLAMLYHERGMYAEAQPLYERAVDIMLTASGGIPPDTARCLNNLAVLYQAAGAYMKAEPLMSRALELRESRLHLELARLSVPRKRALMQLLQRETESLVSLHIDSTPASPGALDLALTAVLRRKGLVLESLVDSLAAARAHFTPQLRSKLDQLATASSELSRFMRTHVPPHRARVHANAVAALRARIDILESEVNVATAALRAKSQLVTPQRIRDALPGGTALVELTRYHRFDPWQDRRRWQEARYAAYVLQRKGQPQWVALGEAAPIDTAVDAVLAHMRPGSDSRATKAALQHLDVLLFAPIREHLDGISHVVISPDGKLNLVPFEALIDAQGRHELEHRLVSYVTSGRDLLHLGSRQSPRSPATIVAAPDYGRGPQFAPLPGASAEAHEVAAHFRGPNVLLGNQVTKAALASIVGPMVLHLATHGFYARNAAPASTTENSPVSTVAEPDVLERDMFVEGALAPSRLPAFDDPADAVDRAGLALANANVRSDGIITAREIAHLDWWGTQLVVLSACQTGVGAAPSGEGVYGLRLALAAAGAESQVVSLWNVADSSARVLMREFYGELARGAGRAQALRQAKLRMLQQPRFAHPYYWAPFIQAGAWTPLGKGVMQAKPASAPARASGAAP